MKFLSSLGLLLLAYGVSAQVSTPEYNASMAHYRSEYKLEFLSEPRSPLHAADTAYLDFFPPDMSYRVEARFRRTSEAQPFKLPTYSGQTRDYVQFGTALFELNGRPHTLNIYQNLRLVQDSVYRDHLFLPFKDPTNGEETYGGGRYIDLRQGDIGSDGVMVIDFNKCYNPWCAYSDGYNCPIPPVENHLETAIRAGERQFKGEKKH